MLAISRPFCPRVSTFHRSFAAPVAAPAPDRRGPPTVAGQQAFARRDRTRLRFCRSKPLHENLYAPAWYQPGRLAATAGNCSEVVNRSPYVDAPRSIRFESTMNVSFLQERAGRAP